MTSSAVPSTNDNADAQCEVLFFYAIGTHGRAYKDPRHDVLCEHDDRLGGDLLARHGAQVLALVVVLILRHESASQAHS
jgi:hypothetical protein